MHTHTHTAYLYEWDKVIFHEIVASIGGRHSDKPGGVVMAAVSDPETRQQKNEPYSLAST